MGQSHSWKWQGKSLSYWNCMDTNEELPFLMSDSENPANFHDEGCVPNDNPCKATVLYIPVDWIAVEGSE